ncbi:MAG: cystathionine beta-synthase [Deltaproteobacteria bacterium]|nr:cystathionine beta-synthase [Deltaproteobacteria bacterium]MBI3064696.1 cystathionine beta-synthase [Deltaproteobacteria bacterium]
MAKILANVLKAVGNTPVIRLNHVTAGMAVTICAKVEACNPGHSVKDRIALALVEDAERRGLLKPGGTIIEPTSGNMGVALAIVAAVKGYKCIFTIPDKMSIEKIRRLRAFGAEVVVTPTAVPPESPQSYYSVAKRLAEEIPGAYMPMQYDNPANMEAHYASTGPEIWEQTDGKITHFVAGMGTGGTISGTAKYLKEKNPNCAVIGVDAEGSILAKVFNGEPWSWNDSHPYKVEGIGEDFVPKNLLFQYVDSVVTVSDRDSFLMGRRLTREEGLFCGGSSGTAVEGALRYARENQLGRDDLVVVLLPDAGEIYLSKMYSDEWMRQNQFLGRSVQVGKILESKRRKLRELKSVEVTSTVRDAIETMNRSGVSQLPVFDRGNLVGSLTESALFQRTMETPDVMELSVGALLEPPFPTVGPEEDVYEIVKLLKTSPAVLVRDEGAYQGIVTRFDVVEHLGGQP